MEHEGSEDCWCNPTIVPVKRKSGAISYVFAHNVPNQTPEQEAQRAATILEAMDIISNMDEE